jgi:circadian clock protein KaiC
MRLLAQDALRYRRQVLALKQFLSQRRCTVLLLDDKTSEPTDLQLHSLAHGVLSLTQVPQQFGSERRHLRVVKMRGMKFLGGNHDFVLDTGRIEVFPRLVAASHHAEFDTTPKTTGSARLDELLGGGLVPGTNLLLLGPSGAGKTTTAVYCLQAELARGGRASYYLFDERLATLVARSHLLGMDMAAPMDEGRLMMQQIDPAELSPGEFSSRVMHDVLERKASFVVIDSLDAYLHAMPGQSFMLLHMHELLSFLNQQGVITLMVVGQHGLVGETHAEIDISYLSDAILLYRYFEAQSQVRTAVSALKSRTAETRRSIHELRLSAGNGVQIGDVLLGFEGVLTGLPTYAGSTPMMQGRP